jgi:hypothetical protein
LRSGFSSGRQRLCDRKPKVSADHSGGRKGLQGGRAGTRVRRTWPFRPRNAGAALRGSVGRRRSGRLRGRRACGAAARYSVSGAARRTPVPSPGRTGGRPITGRVFGGRAVAANAGEGRARRRFGGRDWQRRWWPAARFQVGYSEPVLQVGRATRRWGTRATPRPRSSQRCALAAPRRGFRRSAALRRTGRAPARRSSG